MVTPSSTLWSGNTCVACGAVLRCVLYSIGGLGHTPLSRRLQRSLIVFSQEAQGHLQCLQGVQKLLAAPCERAGKAEREHVAGCQLIS